ncbi:MAG: alpha-D-glucose phosphate-specific phosphoglucomutase [Salinisphaeraceae bacterium]|nr:alpha-D-glucose phosphate-specific phosphoglucomutase [Salinisphaeraceae bacterium]
MQTQTVPFTAFDDQRPGTAGLRKKVAVFQQPHYLESFVEAVLRNAGDIQGETLVLGGDGRFHNRTAIQTILAMAAAHGVRRVIVGLGGLLSTPAASSLIRSRGAAGGFLLTASHNPAGPSGDFGIKYNISNGGQASEALTEAVYASTQALEQYQIAELPEIDIDVLGEVHLEDFSIEIVDPVADYAAQMQQLFDFDAIRDWIKNGGSFRFDAMHAVTGPYARHLFCDLLGADQRWILNAEPKKDFGGGHPDPNLVYAKPLVDLMMADSAPDFAAASDGDGDRNMILGHGCFVSPGDSLAVLAANAQRFPGYAQGLPGVARSMPTSRAVDAVAQALEIPCYETPTGWRFFCNLLEDGRIGFCGEESFGTSSHHTREKDGLWAVLAWMHLLATTGDSVQTLLDKHWQRFGRHYYQRHDYENLDQSEAADLIEQLRQQLPSLTGKTVSGYVVTDADEFAYLDPVDNSRSEGQGLRIVMGEQARIVVRLSGTGTSGATLRVYLERYESTEHQHSPGDALSELANAARVLLKINRSQPDLAT